MRVVGKAQNLRVVRYERISYCLVDQDNKAVLNMSYNDLKLKLKRLLDELTRLRAAAPDRGQKQSRTVKISPSHPYLPPKRSREGT